MNNNKRLVGWGGIAATVVLTLALMAILSATGIATKPAAGTLEAEEAGGSANAIDGAPTGPISATIDVTLSEWLIEPSVTTAKAGAITFNVENVGPSESHEFIILKTDLSADALPTLKDGSLDEEGEGVTSPGEGGVIAPGKKETVTVTMTPGKYVFVDNIVERGGLVHWEKKAHATFIVE